MSDYWVTVCEVCRTASSVLRLEGREHPDHYSRERVLAVCGEVEEVGE